MGGLRAASPSPSGAGAGSDPRPPPRVAMACVLSSEVATVLAVMRRNVRWAGVRYGGDDSADDEHLDHPLIAGLKSLRRRAAAWGPCWRDDIEPLLYLRPFLDVVRSDETGAPITGAALSSLHKILTLDLVAPCAPGAAEAMGAVVDAVTGCRFEVTDPASEEAVLARVLQVLLACVRGRAAPALANRHVCAIVSTCFRVVQQAGTKGELLQRVSRQTMQEVIRCVFARLPDLDVDLLSDQQGSVCMNQGLGAEEIGNGKNDYVCLNSSGDEVGDGSGVVQDKAMMEPFGVPCMIEILQFMCSLLNIAEDIEVNPRVNPIDYDEDVPLFALGLINSAIELSVSSIHRHPKLLAFVQDELFRNLMHFGLSMSPLILSIVCSIVFTLFYHLRHELKLQIEAFFSCVILRLAQSRYGASFQQQEVALEALVDFCRQKEFMAEMYANMDCNLQCSNIFEELANLLSKSAFPVNSPLSALNVLALDGLVAVIQAMAERTDNAPQHHKQAVPEISEYFPFWQLKCDSNTDPDQWVKFVHQQKSIKRKLMVGVEHFNRDKKKGFEYLQGVHLLPAKLDPHNVALFFRYTPGLDKNLLGDYLGNHDEFSIQVLHEFARTFDFKQMNLDAALRLFLETFRLPGESQKIQRILEAFSERYYEQSPQMFVNRDAALVLSYSVILLNTDQHNVRVKKKMTEEDFIRNNRRINGGNDLPREFLSEIYYSICRNEIRTIPEQGAGCSEMSFSRWVDLMWKSKRTSEYIACDSYPFLDNDMFSAMAGSSVAAISVVFDNVEHEEVLTVCIDGFLSVAKLAAFYHLDNVLNDLVVALCKFTTLSSGSYTDDPVTTFGEDTKARMATEAVFTIATTYGDHIRGGWRNIVDCILRLHKIGLLPARLTGDKADDQDSSSDLLPSKLASSAVAPQVLPVSTSKKSYGLMGRFSQLLYLDAEEPRSQPTEEQLAAQRNAAETVKKCQIGTIFTESKFLQADSLSDLASALIQAAGRPQKITSSLNDEDTAVFCLELLITVTLNNRDRIVLLWQGVYEHIAHIVQSTVMPCNLVEKAVFGLLLICQRLLPYKENLVDDLLRSLQLILKLDARVADAYCENITLEVTRLVKANATHIKSQMGWRTIISLLCITARHPDASDAGFEALVFIMSEGAHLSPANFVLSVEASRQFAESRLGSAERSIHALNLMEGSVNCLTRWSREVKEAGGEADRILEGIAEMWLRLVQALRKVCTDQREEIRNHALLSLHRCLVVDGIAVSSSAWLMSFDIIFQLLDELLEIAQNYSPKDFRNMEVSLLHAVKLLCKVFLQSLKDLSAQSSFGKLWLEVLDMIDKFMKVKGRGRRTEKLQEAIPELVNGDLPLLKSLDVSFNQLSTLPEEIGLATALVKVDLSNNYLKELPDSLAKCLALSELKASNNNINRLPDALADCSKLSKLDLEGNKLVKLSENMFASWIMLTELNLAKNLLTTIPESIGTLSKLIRLDLHQNKITSIPPSISGCSSLAEFYMGNNFLSSIPADIGTLSKLGILDLHSNQLKEYPVGACNLKLTFLDLSNNSLSGLPAELGKMTTLRKLLLTGNPVRTLRSSLVSGPTTTLLKYLRSRLASDEEASGSKNTPTKDDQITAARRLSLSSKELDLSGLGVTYVPPEAWETSDVVKLDLSKNSIEVLPDELSLCSSLQSLVLSNNKIKRWPRTVVSSLPNLSSLKLDNNPLAQVSSNDLVSLSKLEVLDISGNASALPEPSAVSELPHLQELYLRRMKLHEFPNALLALKQLRILDLSQNSLATVPEGIKEFTALIKLDLSDNNITALPAELGLLEPNLQVLKLDGNPLRSIRRTLLERGTKAILKYLKEKLPTE